jgi:hypothetical protein
MLLASSHAVSLAPVTYTHKHKTDYNGLVRDLAVHWLSVRHIFPDYTSGFFHEIISPSLLIHTLRPFQIIPNSQDIQS